MFFGINLTLSIFYIVVYIQILAIAMGYSLMTELEKHLIEALESAQV